MAERATMYGTKLTETVQSGAGNSEAAFANVSELGGATMDAGWVCGAHQADSPPTADNPVLVWDDDIPALEVAAGVDVSAFNYGCFAVCSASLGSTKQSAYAGDDTKVKTTHSLGLELDKPSDNIAKSTGNSTRTAATFASKVTLNTTPATTGEFLFICTALRQHGSTSQEHRTQLQITEDPSGTNTDTNYNNVEWRPASTSQVMPWCCVVKHTLTGGTEYDIKIEWQSDDGSTTAEIRQAHIIMLRLDLFKNFYYFENGGGRGRVGHTSNHPTFTDYITANPTILNAGNHLIVGAMTLDGRINTNQYCRLHRDPAGTPIEELVIVHRPTTSSPGGDTHDSFVIMKKNLSAGASGPNTWKWQAARTSGPGSAGGSNGAICIIELEEAMAGRIISLGQTAVQSKIVYTG